MTTPKDWPEGLAPYKRTPEFTETTVPPARLHVLAGKLRFVDDVSGQETTLAPGIHHCIYPTREHHVTSIGEVRFFIEFCRPSGDKPEEIRLATPDNLPHRRKG